MFISEPCGDTVYAAEPSAKGGKYRWSVVSVSRTDQGPCRVAVAKVPQVVRKRAYRYFEAARLLLSAGDPSDER